MDKALEKLKALKDVYKKYADVKIGDDLKFKIRVLSSIEETEVHSYASSFEQGLAYLYAVKRDTICRAIEELNGTKLPDFIEDGEEKVERYVWLRDNIVSGWNQLLIDEAWGHYAELVTETEEKITGGLKKEKEEKEDDEK